MANINPKHGHRERLRKRFISNPESFTDSELLELILTYSIPRMDVAPLADKLLFRFVDITGVLSASYKELCEVEGIGEQAAILLTAIDRISSGKPNKENHLQERMMPQKTEQAKLFEVEPALGPLFEEPKETPMRSFVDDEIANSMQFIPEAKKFSNFVLFKDYLKDNLPYNSVSTRQRRADFIINRYFKQKEVNTPLTYFADKCSDPEDLKSAIFFETLNAEPLAAKTADEFIWPALAYGYVERDDMRAFILECMPDLSNNSQNKVLNAIFRTYILLSVGTEQNGLLHFQIHKGTLESFLYVLTAEYPKPGVYSFESLYNGPMRHWLLWDKEWIRQQLYNLQDFGIIAKISEIDTVRQFTTQLDQMTALRTYFEHPQRGLLSIREREL